MTDDLRALLFERYHETQARTASGAIYADPRAAWDYYDANYGPQVAGMDRGARILEIGPGHGSFLLWLRERGFREIGGVDVSPGDVEYANRMLGESLVHRADASEFLAGKYREYDLVVAKAVLEHVTDGVLVSLLDGVARAVKPGGRFLVDVPNMDWFAASHERYMDLTHTRGFTPESLATILGLFFEDVAISGSRIGRETKLQRAARRPLLALIRRVLYVLGEGADSLLWHSRSLIAVASHPTQA